MATSLPKISRFLRDEDGVGSPNLNVDGSVTPVHFDLLGPENQGGRVFGFKFVIRAMAIRPDRFGDIADGLGEGEGLLLSIVDGSGEILLDFHDGEEIRTNTDIAILCGKGYNTTMEAGIGLIEATFLIPKHGGELLSSGLRIRASVQADLRPLQYFRIYVRGRWLPG